MAAAGTAAERWLVASRRQSGRRCRRGPRRASTVTVFLSEGLRKSWSREDFDHLAWRKRDANDIRKYGLTDRT
jgi:hypothetical protein